MSQGAEERPVISEKVQVHTLESLEKMHTTKTAEGATAASAGKKPEVRSHICTFFLHRTHMLMEHGWKYIFAIEEASEWTNI